MQTPDQGSECRIIQLDHEFLERRDYSISPLLNELACAILEIWLLKLTSTLFADEAITSNPSRKTLNKGRKCSRTIGRAALRSTLASISKYALKRL